MRILRSLIDPSHISTRIFPNEDIDLFIAAHHNYLLAFDNLSYLSNSVSDVLCQLATGGGFGTRKLYTDQDELLISVSRPVVLNGIENVAARPDLVDRSVFLTLKDCRAESELWASFEQARPRILGALLNAMVVGLNRLPEIQLPTKPRMADFAQWAAACETAFWLKGRFLSTYFENRQEAMEDTVESDPVASSIRALMVSVSHSWEGTASELLMALGDIADERVVKSKRWPGNASALSRYLRRVALPLRRVGIEISTLRKSGNGSNGKRTRVVHITSI